MVNIPGVIGIIVFYIIILAVGIWAARKSKKTPTTAGLTDSEDVMLAGRDIGLFIGVFTMTGRYLFIPYQHNNYFLREADTEQMK
ncbi:unnamed protein product [Schistocephalus solidus]|uniref:Sodium:solute symporter family protein n=1 Tax=Schistocephalus solidus TaxID=70667 RepID=A0A183TNK4_SCHSO|nr:unnamed protein product [Schistocephalus solidus]